MPRGSWQQIRHCRDNNTEITPEAAIATRGALLFTFDNPKDVFSVPSRPGKAHVAFSCGDGFIVEAASPKNGIWLTSAKRTWTHAGLIPGVDYAARPAPDPVPKPNTETTNEATTDATTDKKSGDRIDMTFNELITYRTGETYPQGHWAAGAPVEITLYFNGTGVAHLFTGHVCDRLRKQGITETELDMTSRGELLELLRSFVGQTPSPFDAVAPNGDRPNVLHDTDLHAAWVKTPLG
jgi:hypothetical protein